ncbi:MAG: pyridoxine 5-phosphate synthase [Acidobacteriota bacterium]|jgi:pyridoxine 5-phosphate synthase|nr:pyridoxine 5-phosphate synthase [Acidobacteriota bacterium]
MTRLSVNVNKVATLRNTRTSGIPDVARFARLALAAGADGITIHPRPDERHIRAGDVAPIGAAVAEVAGVAGAELCIEGNPFTGLLEHARRVHPTQCTLVPDANDVLTSDAGWDLSRTAAQLAPVVAELRALGIRVSLFMTPGEPLAIARELGAEAVELYTGAYADEARAGDASRELALLRQSADEVRALGLRLHAGHDLDLTNLPQFVALMPEVAEVSIGHALLGDALEFGIAETVRRYQEAMKGRALRPPLRS